MRPIHFSLFHGESKEQMLAGDADKKVCPKGAFSAQKWAEDTETPHHHRLCLGSSAAFPIREELAESCLLSEREIMTG